MPRGGTPRTRRPRASDGLFPVVGIGASAGGLDALDRLLRQLPGDTGMAFVLVQHLDPQHKSRLTEILSRVTTMPALEVRDRMRIDPDHLYIIPPNTNMLVEDGMLRLKPRKPRDGTPFMPVDALFRSMAQTQKNRAVGVILSGTASDGASGMKAIKAEGGITFAQDSGSARYYGMPHSSILAGAVDFILPPEDIARSLARIGRHPYVKLPEQEVLEQPLPAARGEALNRLLRELKRAHGVDFSAYKQSTVGRRIRRRMALHGIEALEDYLRHIRTRPEELRELFQDMFVGVTGFFREPDAFKALRKLVYPKILKAHREDEPLRIWVPGCSTGEEVYSIAISLLEHLRGRSRRKPFQVFGTDVDEQAIRRARRGRYPESVAADVGPTRLNRFFVRTENGYEVNKAVRDMCVFARHDIAHDPPFSRLDLLSCRNVLIYLSAPLQQKLLPLFHYSLRSTGFLLLGSAETIGGFSEMFTLVDRKHKIYARRPGPSDLRMGFPVGQLAVPPEAREAQRRSPPSRAESDLLRDAADLTILNEYAPAAVVVNEDMEIVQFRGHTGSYLEPAPGVATLNLMKMAREGLVVGLHTAFEEARRRDTGVRQEGLRVRVSGHERTVTLHVIPLRTPVSGQRSFLVLFEEVPDRGEPPPGPEAKVGGPRRGRPRPARRDDPRLEQLKQEIATTRTYRQSIIESQKAGNEELRSMNEKLLSTNEELQSTSEELETSNEELQSANEELITLNEELQNRNTALGQANDDILNLLTSMSVSIVIVDAELRVRRLTSMAEHVLGLHPSDVGRPLSTVRLAIDIPDLEQVLRDTMKTARRVQREVQCKDGRWLSLHIHPYITVQNRIEGAVMVLSDIRQIELAAGRFRSFIESAPDPIVILDHRGRIGFVNVETEHLFGHSRGSLLGSDVGMLVPAESRAELATFLRTFRRRAGTRAAKASRELDAVRADGVEFPAEITLRAIEAEDASLLVGLVRDLTERRNLERRTRLAAVLEERNRLAREVHDSLAQSLSGVVLQLEGAEEVLGRDPKEAQRQIVRARDLARSSLEEARRSLLALRPQLLEHGDLPSALAHLVDEARGERRSPVELSVRGRRRRLTPEAEENVLRIVQEAIYNAERHAGARRIAIALQYTAQSIQMRIEDDGRGFDPGSRRAREGFGLSTMKDRAERLGGRFRLRSEPGKGTSLEVWLPLGPSPIVERPR